MNDLQRLRQHLKRARQALPARTQSKASAAVNARILGLPRFLKARRMAAYFGTGGEIDPMPLIEHATSMGKQCYLPVLHPFRRGQLLFCRWRPGEALVMNRFNIPEPVVRHDRLIAPRDLDLVILPLLGFDHDCNRIGMGGGFYDRTFAFMHRLNHIAGPYLLGLAHEIQRVEVLVMQRWDIPLDAVATEQRIYCAEGRR